MSFPVQQRLHAFATALLERRGALVEWPAAEEPGVAMLPPELAAEVGAAEEVVPLVCEAADKGLSVSLAGDFLDWAGRLLEAEPRVGAFRIRELYLKRKDLDEAVRRAFTWLNAKVKVHEARETAIEYHTWWFYAAIQSEDRWESRLAVALFRGIDRGIAVFVVSGHADRRAGRRIDLARRAVRQELVVLHRPPNAMALPVGVRALERTIDDVPRLIAGNDNRGVQIAA